MMWQIVSGSYYNRLDEGIPYSHYLRKARDALKETDDGNGKINQYLGYHSEIQRVRILVRCAFSSFSVGYQPQSSLPSILRKRWCWSTEY